MWLLTFIKKHLLFFSVLVFIAVLATSAALFTNTGEAAGLLLPFGGRVTAMTICTCSPAIALFVAGTMTRPPGFYSLPAGARVYANYQTRPPAWVKGKYIPGLQTCWMYYGATCAPLPDVMGTIVMIGTSKI